MCTVHSLHKFISHEPVHDTIFIADRVEWGRLMWLKVTLLRLIFIAISFAKIVHHNFINTGVFQISYLFCDLFLYKY